MVNQLLNTGALLPMPLNKIDNTYQLPLLEPNLSMYLRE